jgi:DNA end-binding protein Ku
MASMKDAATVAEQLEALAGRLHAEVTEGRMDFGEMARLADEIGESADAIAAAFFAIDEAFTRHLAELRAEAAGPEKTGQRGAGETRGREQKAKADDATESKEDLLERAKQLEIAGRSTMPKEELAAAIQSEEQVSKEELLGRAREAGIPGRSSMSKEELAEAVRSEESVSKEELLERAREADIQGRSDMSKEELREALRSQ